MSRLMSKRNKRSSRNRSLRQGLERLEIRNLLACDPLQDDFMFVAKEDPGFDEGSVEVASDGLVVEEANEIVEASEDADSPDGEPKPEEKVLADEQPEGSSSAEIREPSDEDPASDDSVVNEEVIEVPCLDADPLYGEPMIYFRSLSGDVVDKDAIDEEAIDGEVLDDSIFYTLSFGDAGEIDGEPFLEMVPNSDDVQSDDASDDGEIRTFGGTTSEDIELFSATGAPFMSPWYNPDNPLDTDLDGVTTALDALIVFNSLSHFGSVQLSRSLFSQNTVAEAFDLDENFLVDASNDGYLSPLDALMRINYLSQPVADDSADANADQGRLGQFASIVAGEWDQYESADQDELNDSRPSEDSGDELSTEVFGSRIRDPNIDWPDDELDSEPNDGEADDEFWSKFADDDSEAMLDEETLDLLAQS